MTERLLPEQRIRRRGIFQRIFQNGKRARGRFLQLWSYRGAELLEDSKRGLPQVAIIVSRRVSPRAHIRNRWKRRVREIFRRAQGQIKTGTGVLIQVRAGTAQTSFEEIRAEIHSLLEKTNSLK